MSWIWIDKKCYPEFQNSYYNILFDCENKETHKYNYCVAEFKREFIFEKALKSIKIYVSADSFYQLYINGNIEGIGPASSGGDFLCVGKTPKHYINKHFVKCNGNKIFVSAFVRLLPQMLTNYSKGHGGFYFEGEVVFEDGTSNRIYSDYSWLSRVNAGYKDFDIYDANLCDKFAFNNSSIVEDIWNAEVSPIPSLSMNEIFSNKIFVCKNETKTVRIDFDKIYGVYPKIISNGNCKIALKTSELEGQTETTEIISLTSDFNQYFSFRMHSAGTLRVEIENTDNKDIEIIISFVATWYPVITEGAFETDNKDLNKVYDVCKHTLKICRQSLHLDSTKHQELLACTGDYYIESLMTMFCFGDMRLAEFDLMRTADWLVANDGVMFHTTYSLIWVQMLHDVYMITGNKQLLLYCKNALNILLCKFDTYIGENGVIDNPPDFMFVDWSVIDGYSMHHPPKALGQTVLNCFYYKALIDAEKIYSYIDETDICKNLKIKADTFKIKFNEVFFDKEKKLYFDGLGTPYGGEKYYHPENINKKYFSKYPNILASLYELTNVDLAIEIIDRIIFNDELQDVQPYFMHFLLCAIRKYNLFDKYGFRILARWIDMVNECDKGLKEGWFAPEDGYSFDHSHAWGGTPAYQMPMAITGLEIIEPGMKTIKFTPDLYKLNYARIKIPVKNGFIDFYAEKGEETQIIAPEGITIIRGDVNENS